MKNNHSSNINSTVNNNGSNDKAVPFGLLQAKAKSICHSLNSKIKLANNKGVHQRILAFTKARYKTCFPAITLDSKQHYIANSFVFYSEDTQGNITATASLMVDSSNGFSEEQLFNKDIKHYRQQGLNSLQIGRFVIGQQHNSNGEIVTLKDYFSLFYQFSKQLGFDVVIGLIKQKDVAFHQKLLGAKILCLDTQVDYDGEHTFAVSAWQLDELKPRFFKWANCQPIETSTQKTIYQPDEWENYARSFAAVQTSFQRDLQLASAALLCGDVADFGCGSAKLAPFLTDKEDVSSYTGIDYSSEMIKIADWLIAQFNCPSFSTVEGKIEDYQGKTFDSAVSLNSYYTWPDPLKVLQHIHSLLKSDGLFVLATPNTQLDMQAMEKEVRKELLTHPEYSVFRQINSELTENIDARFIEMDMLIKQLQGIGFAIISCHQTFYLGGLNFVVMKKL
jgi:SAM-dependent methyltransferase